MIQIDIDKRIAEVAPDYRCLQIECSVENAPTSARLTELLNDECDAIHNTLSLSDINKRAAIAATRKAYKALGKDPNRYRPSAEALCRRAVKESGLYTINALVDLINLVSICSGYSIGGFDLDKIEGDRITLGVGEEGEPFEAIGRGLLNIAGLPVFRDSIGGIGTPTSDNERTKLSLDTKRLLLTVNIYGEEMSPEDTVAYIRTLLDQFADCRDFEYRIVSPASSE